MKSIIVTGNNGEIGKEIQDYIESKEITIDNVIFENLTNIQSQYDQPASIKLRMSCL